MRGLILAAGLGTRLRPITERIPKPCVPLLNVPLGYWPLHHLLKAGLKDLIVNTHHLPEQVVSLFDAKRTQLQSLEFSHEPGKILGSGGGINKAKSFLSRAENFWAVNGDEVFLPDNSNWLSSAWQDHCASDRLATLLVTRHPLVGTKFGGVWADDDGWVKGFGKQPPTPHLKGYHFLGFQIISSRVFRYMPEPNTESNILYDQFVAALAAGEKIAIAHNEGLWFETGNSHDLLEATSELIHVITGSKGEASHRQWLTGLLNEHRAGQMNGSSFLHSSAKVGTGAALEGQCVLGAGSVVEKNSWLKNVIVLPGSKAQGICEDVIL